MTFDLLQHGVEIKYHAVIRYLQRAKGVDIQHGQLADHMSVRQAKRARRARDSETMSVLQTTHDIEALKAEMIADLKAGNGRTLSKMKESGKVKAYGASGVVYYTSRPKPGAPLAITTIWHD